MKDTPSALKWLAEKRARTSSELKQVERVYQQLKAKREQLGADLAALDRDIRMYDVRMDPNGIETMSPHKHECG